MQARLQAVQAEILGLGVRRLALFGSVRRDTARPDIDVDLLVEFEPEQRTRAHLVDLGDPILQRAIVRSLEIIGEASKRLPASMRDANPAVEWRAMARMRNRLIHD